MKVKNSYDAIIIGFGKGGKTLAGFMGNAGKRTALIERSPEMYGGTCINVGCIPTKFLAQKAKEARSNQTFTEKKAAYKQAIEQELELTCKLRTKNLKKAEKTPNVTVITGVAKLISNTEVEVKTDDCTEILKGEQIFINTGSAPFIPNIEGLKDNPYALTSEELLDRFELPERIVIIGGGYIGVEFASIYTDFGSRVTMIQNENTFLPKEDEDIANAVYEHLKSRGVELILGAEIERVFEQNGKAGISLTKNGITDSITADIILVATGRRPNTENLNLENVGVKLNERGGIAVNEHLQSTVPNIYAMGDVVGGLQFTYISLDDFRIVRSAISGDGSYTVRDRGVIPYSVFINPPFSKVGMSEKEARESGHSVKVTKMHAAAIPKTQILEQPTGILKAIIDEKTERILGAHLFCESSHEIINIIKLAMDANLHYKKLRDMIFTHPTMSEALNELFNF